MLVRVEGRWSSRQKKGGSTKKAVGRDKKKNERRRGRPLNREVVCVASCHLNRSLLGEGGRVGRGALKSSGGHKSRASMKGATVSNGRAINEARGGVAIKSQVGCDRGDRRRLWRGAFEATGPTRKKKNASVPFGVDRSPHAQPYVLCVRGMARSACDEEFLSADGAIPERGEGRDGQQKKKRA